MKRYSPEINCQHGFVYEDAEGEYVRYDEAAVRIAELEAALHVKQLQVNDAVTRIAELEAAIDKLAQCKGRFHTEANFKALVAVREKNLHK